MLIGFIGIPTLNRRADYETREHYCKIRDRLRGGLVTFPHEQIEKRAYAFYLARECEEGKALDHWLAAKLSLLLERLEGAEKAKDHCPDMSLVYEDCR